MTPCQLELLARNSSPDTAGGSSGRYDDMRELIPLAGMRMA